MEFEPYKDLVRSIVIQELKECGWVELIALPVENPEKSCPEAIQAAIETVHNLLYRADKLELSIQGTQLCIRNVEGSGRTFRICASYTGYNGPTLVV